MIGNSYTLADVVTLVAASHLLTFTVWGLRAIDRQDRREARRREARRRHPTAVLCGECSPSLDDWAEWADAGEIAPANRIRCARCGQ